MKIVVFGAGGMLGSDLVSVLSSDASLSVHSFGSDVDITDAVRVSEVLSEIQPSYVVNCAAYTDVDGAEDDEENALRINGYALDGISHACNAVSAHLIQISTDYVFDGNKEEGYGEDDTGNPLGVYGRSKLLGEELIAKHCESYSIVRTSWLFGKHGKNFVDTISRLLEEKEEIKVVDDQRGSPTYTFDLTEGLVEMIRSGKATGKSIFHLTNSGVCSWYAFALEIQKQTGLACRILPCSTEEFPRPAPRPACSVLINTKLPPLESWKDALMRYLER